MPRFTPLALSLGLAGSALADSIIIPNAAATRAGPGGYSTILHAAARGYQLVIGSAELSGLPVGSRITGIQFRRPSWQVHPSWPPAPASFTAYDINLSRSNFPPGALSRTYTENIGPDAVDVRTGPITFPTGFFPGGALTPATNPFSPVIEFSTPYTYNGGDLLVTIRHTGNGFSSGSLDTVSSVHCQAIGVSSYTQPNDWYNQGPIVMRLSFEPGGDCPADFNGDGQVDFFDYLDFVQAFANEDPAADFNRDGQIDFFDYLDFVAAFSAGCD